AVTEVRPAAFKQSARWICGVIIAGSAVSLFVLMHALNMPGNMTLDLFYGRGDIVGVQGRYFIPLAPLGFALLANRRLQVNARLRTALSVVVILIASGAAYAAIWQTYYRYWNAP